MTCLKNVIDLGFYFQKKFQRMLIFEKNNKKIAIFEKSSNF